MDPGQAEVRESHGLSNTDVLDDFTFLGID